jgi:hypothetical protein
VVDAAAAGNAQQPGLHCVAVTQGIELFPGLHERFLHEVVGVGEGAGQAAGAGPYEGAVPAGQRLKGCRFAVGGPSGQ